jgi:hypothetical protein
MLWLLLSFLACRATAPLVRPHGDDLFISTGSNYTHAEVQARQFCADRGAPIMRPVDKREYAFHVTGDRRIEQLELIFRCEAHDVPRTQP